MVNRGTSRVRLEMRGLSRFPSVPNYSWTSSTITITRKGWVAGAPMRAVLCSAVAEPSRPDGDEFRSQAAAKQRWGLQQTKQLWLRAELVWPSIAVGLWDTTC